MAMSVVSPKKSPWRKRMSFTGCGCPAPCSATISPDSTMNIDAPLWPSWNTAWPGAMSRGTRAPASAASAASSTPPKNGVRARKVMSSGRAVMDLARPVLRRSGARVVGVVPGVLGVEDLVLLRAALAHHEEDTLLGPVVHEGVRDAGPRRKAD